MIMIISVVMIYVALGCSGSAKILIVTMKAVYCGPGNENLVPVRSRHSVFKMASLEFRLATARISWIYTPTITLKK